VESLLRPAKTRKLGAYKKFFMRLLVSVFIFLNVQHLIVEDAEPAAFEKGEISPEVWLQEGRPANFCAMGINNAPDVCSSMPEALNEPAQMPKLFRKNANGVDPKDDRARIPNQIMVHGKVMSLQSRP